MARPISVILWTSVLIVLASVNDAFADPVAISRENNQKSSEDIFRHLVQLENRLATVEKKLANTEFELVQQKEVTAKQEKEIKRQGDLIEVLLKITNVNTDVNALKQDTIETMDIETTRDEHQPNVSHLENRSGKNISFGLASNSLRETGRRIARQGYEDVAFSAYLSHDTTGYGPSQTIICDGVILNDGNGYNKITGIFTVPIDGVYLFFFACEDYHAHRIYIQLVVDGVAKSTILETPTGGHAMGANAVIVRVSSGQSVWVRTHPYESGDTFQSSTTTFSGTLLYTS